MVMFILDLFFFLGGGSFLVWSLEFWVLRGFGFEGSEPPQHLFFASGCFHNLGRARTAATVADKIA